MGGGGGTYSCKVNALYKVFFKAEDGAITGAVTKCTFYVQIMEMLWRKNRTDGQSDYYC